MYNKMNCMDIAIKIIDRKYQDEINDNLIELNESLKGELIEIAEMCDTVDASLQSRQLICMIIFNWQLRNPGSKPYEIV